MKPYIKQQRWRTTLRERGNGKWVTLKKSLNFIEKTPETDYLGCVQGIDQMNITGEKIKLLSVKSTKKSTNY